MIESKSLTTYALNQIPKIVQVTCTPTNRQRCRQASVATYQYVNYSQVAPPRDHAPPREVSWINTRDQSLTQVNLPSKPATLNCLTTVQDERTSSSLATLLGEWAKTGRWRWNSSDSACRKANISQLTIQHTHVCLYRYLQVCNTTMAIWYTARNWVTHSKCCYRVAWLSR